MHGPHRRTPNEHSITQSISSPPLYLQQIKLVIVSRDHMLLLYREDDDISDIEIEEKEKKAAISKLKLISEDCGPQENQTATITTKKRGRKLKAKEDKAPGMFVQLYVLHSITFCIVSQAQDQAQDQPTVLPVKELLFSLSMFSAHELKKKAKNRHAKGALFRLTVEEVFDTFKAQLLHAIDAQLKPSLLDFHSYNISYTIKRSSATPMTLCDEADYEHLLECTWNVKMTPEINVVIHE